MSKNCLTFAVLPCKVYSIAKQMLFSVSPIYCVPFKTFPAFLPWYLRLGERLQPISGEAERYHMALFNAFCLAVYVVNLVLQVIALFYWLSRFHWGVTHANWPIHWGGGSFRKVHTQVHLNTALRTRTQSAPHVVCFSSFLELLFI